MSAICNAMDFVYILWRKSCDPIQHCDLIGMCGLIASSRILFYWNASLLIILHVMVQTRVSFIETVKPRHSDYISMAQSLRLDLSDCIVRTNIPFLCGDRHFAVVQKFNDRLDECLCPSQGCMSTSLIGQNERTGIDSCLLQYFLSLCSCPSL